MTDMLASVADAAEAEIASRGGADIVDFKDPRRGALGALDLDIVEAAAAAIARPRRLSATLGDPPYEPAVLHQRARALIALGVDDLKLAVDAATLDQLTSVLADLAPAASLIGMMFADERPAFSLLSRLASLGFKGAMLDTRDKSSGRLISHLDILKLEAFCAACRDADLKSGLAGSLEAPDVPRLLLARPDVLGFRGALCRRHVRDDTIDPAAFALIRDLIPRQAARAGPVTKVDWRIFARGLIGERESEAELDHVFVNDFVTPTMIGAYDYERKVPQRVKFDVDASVRRAGALAEDMRAIFSYDLILDAIRLAAGSGHHEFVEGLVEEIAAAILRHPRVRAVRVAARKLDVIEGSVGVEIQRRRAGAASDERPYALFARGPTG